MLIWSDTLFVVVAALAFDALIGDPDWLWRRLPHPVALIGSFIGLLDRSLNLDTRSPAQRKFAGVSVVVLLLVTSALVGFLIEFVLRQIPFGNVLLGLAASTLIAQRSLYQHVARVRAAFADGGLAEARRAVSMIVGRDPDQLDEAGVCRAAIESCAENFSDGVVAPVFWLALLGLPGLDRLQGHQYRRLHDRPPQRALRVLWLGGRTVGRSRQFDPGTAIGVTGCDSRSDRGWDDWRQLSG